MLKTFLLIPILLRFKDNVLIMTKKALWDLASHYFFDLVSKIITVIPFQSYWSSFSSYFALFLLCPECSSTGEITESFTKNIEFEQISLKEIEHLDEQRRG